MQATLKLRGTTHSATVLDEVVSVNPTGKRQVS